MNEQAPKINSPAELGATLSRSAQEGYYYKLARPEKTRHPQAQTKIEEVFGSADGEGQYKDVVLFDHVSGSDYMNRAFVDPIRTWQYDKPGREHDRYRIEDEHIQALRAGDIEREFLTERLVALEMKLGDVALGVKPGKWQRFKEATLTGRPDDWLSPASMEKEKAFVEGRLAAIPSEGESRETINGIYERNEGFIRGEAEAENRRRDKEVIKRKFEEIVSTDFKSEDDSLES